MKYIRTDDNQIINVEKLKEDYDIKIVGSCLQLFYKFGITPVEAYKIVKQADTIEELSDCFVAVDKNGNLCEDPMIAKGHCFKSFCNYYKAKKIDVDCYLAILTSKGLIYVAKMNEKGELELL